MDRPAIPESAWLRLVAGAGGCLGALLGGEVLALRAGLSVPPDAYLTGALTSGVAILGLLYGACWAAGTLSRDRHRRVAVWCLAGGLVFLALNGAVMASRPPETPLYAISWVRWALSLGGGTGVLIGVFEARAIERTRLAERRRVERQEAEQQNELLAEFARSVAHDLRNPLAIATGSVELARDEVDSDHLASAERALDRMESIVDGTLELAREGRTVGETTRVDLEALVTDCWATVDVRDAELVVETLPAIEADPDRLRHVFENLFRNSVEHGSPDSRAKPGDAVEHGGHEVTVRVGSLAADEGFFVEDDGPGIPPDRTADVFETGYTSTEGGSGYGLGIVERIVDAHGWEIDVTSGEAGGARFEISGVSVVQQPRTRASA